MGDSWIWSHVNLEILMLSATFGIDHHSSSKSVPFFRLGRHYCDLSHAAIQLLDGGKTWENWRPTDPPGSNQPVQTWQSALPLCPADTTLQTTCKNQNFGQRCAHSCLRGPHDTARQCAISNAQQSTYKTRQRNMADLNWPNKNLELASFWATKFPTSPASCRCHDNTTAGGPVPGTVLRGALAQAPHKDSVLKM